MKLIALPEEMHDYLMHVLEAYCRSGIDTKELTIMANTHQRVAMAQDIDFSQLGKAKLEKLGPDGAKLVLEPEETTPAEPALANNCDR